jgi:hypothetical protein
VSRFVAFLSWTLDGVWFSFFLCCVVFISKSHLSLVSERCRNLIAIFMSFVLGCGLGWFCVVLCLAMLCCVWLCFVDV